MTTIETITKGFISELSKAVEASVRERAARALAGTDLFRGVAARVAKPTRRKGPVQLCPVPGCAGRAAPVFGMVCKAHKNVPRKQIAKYREARRARKAN